MNEAQFRDGLDAYGADFAAWPEKHRRAAQQWLERDPAARVLLENAQRLDERLVRHLGSASAQPAAAHDAVERILAPLQQKLPPQRRAIWRAWPQLLLAWDFAPAWPRVAAFATVAAVGFLVGFIDFYPPEPGS